MYAASFCGGAVGEAEACIALWLLLAHADSAIATSEVAEIRMACEGVMLFFLPQAGWVPASEVLPARDIYMILSGTGFGR